MNLRNKSVTDIVIPKHVRVSGGDSFCQGMDSLVNARIESDSLTSINSMCASCNNLVSIAGCGSNVTSMCSAYFNCPNLTTAVCGPNVTDMSGAYANCKNLATAVCGHNVTNMCGAYDRCTNLTDAVCGPNVVNMASAYQSCDNLTTSVCGSNVVDMSYAFCGCSNLRTAVCGKSVTNMYATYCACNNIVDAACGPNVLDMSGSYSGCTNLKTAACGQKVINMFSSYDNCTNLKTSVCGQNVINMSCAYIGCNNLTTATCGTNVTNMARAYVGCSNLNTGVCGPNVTNMYCAYSYCTNLTTAVCGPNVVDMSEAFYDCINLKTIIMQTKNPPYASSAFYNVPQDVTFVVPVESLNVYTTNSFWNGANIIPDKNVALLNVKNITVQPDQSKLVEINYFVFDNTLEKQLDVISYDEEIVTISDVYMDDDGNISFSIDTLGVEGETDIEIALSSGDDIDVQTFHVKVVEYSPSTYTVESLGTSYGFELNSNGYYESQNYGINSSYAICRVNIQSNGVDTMYLDCINYAEGNYDYGILSQIDQTLELNNNREDGAFKSFYGLSDDAVQIVDYGVIPYGDHFIYVKYRKDSSGNYNNDSFQFKVRFEQ